MGGEDAIGVAEQGPRPDPGEAPAVFDRDAAEMTADIDQDAVALALAVEARATGAKDDGDAGAAAIADDPRDVVGVVRHHHSLGQQPVRARVRGIADEVADAAEKPAWAQQLLQLPTQRLRRPARRRIGNAIGSCRHRRRH